MLSTNDFKRGLRIELDGEPWQIVDYNTQTGSGRGGNTLVKTRIRNIRTGQILDRAFRGGEKFKEPDFEVRNGQYLYVEGENVWFMDQESFEQFPLRAADIEVEMGYIRPNDEVRLLVFNGQCIGIEVPSTVILVVEQTDPGAKGDTVSAVTKPARLETGLEIQVPLFVEAGERLVVDTREARYVRRA